MYTPSYPSVFAKRREICGNAKQKSRSIFHKPTPQTNRLVCKSAKIDKWPFQSTKPIHIEIKRYFIDVWFHHFLLLFFFKNLIQRNHFFFSCFFVRIDTIPLRYRVKYIRNANQYYSYFSALRVYVRTAGLFPHCGFCSQLVAYCKLSHTKAIVKQFKHVCNDLISKNKKNNKDESRGEMMAIFSFFKKKHWITSLITFQATNVQTSIKPKQV